MGDSLRVRVETLPGGVTFTADRPNSAGVTTALYLQRLRSVAERPRPKHDKLVSLHIFEPGSLSVTVPVLRGWYEASVRMVDRASGQTTPLVRLGRADVSQ